MGYKTYINLLMEYDGIYINICDIPINGPIIVQNWLLTVIQWEYAGIIENTNIPNHTILDYPENPNEYYPIGFKSQWLRVIPIHGNQYENIRIAMIWIDLWD